MQGRKEFTPQLFYELSLERLVPPDNFYRRVNQALDLHFLYKSTQKYYGTQGQESIQKPLYDKMHEKLTQNKAYHRRLVKRRSATVEPVLGTLINFFNLKRINSRGISQANKHVLMSSLSYNLKKYLRFTVKKSSVLAQVLSLKQGKNYAFIKQVYLKFKRAVLSYPNFRIPLDLKILNCSIKRREKSLSTL
ncbi:transposase [Empedobacter stercoris]|uniref:transposase n=1 Tax=Empedobacter stercoris TaxID=1628248 RepID=UPI0021AF7C43|nr:transposase [Empedobacter stercoris]UWX68263.1 transposase [Empedobacter stercoris]